MTIPARLIVDPLAPIPAWMGKSDRRRLEELRSAYKESMQESFVGASCGTPDDIAANLMGLIGQLHVESLVVVALNARLDVKGPPTIVSRGSEDATDVPLRAILRAVLVQEASSFVVAHNHPMGTAKPSDADQAVTRRLVAAGRAIDCPLVDHIIITRSGAFYSFRRNEPALWR